MDRQLRRPTGPLDGQYGCAVVEGPLYCPVRNRDGHRVCLWHVEDYVGVAAYIARHATVDNLIACLSLVLRVGHSAQRPHSQAHIDAFVVRCCLGLLRFVLFWAEALDVPLLLALLLRMVPLPPLPRLRAHLETLTSV